MPAKTLTLGQLNRATLARQMLLAREARTPLRAIERLVGLQAQLARPPFVGLWSRVRDFHADQLTRMIQRRKVVRATMMRATLHIMSAKDYVSLRASIQPALTRAMHSALRRRADGLDVQALVKAARRHLERAPQTFEHLRAELSQLDPKGDERAMGYAVRLHLPLVQVPEETTWGYPGTAKFTPAESWLGKPIAAAEEKPRGLVLRYLAAFGPASAADVQAWSGLTGLREVLDELGAKLRVFEDERGRELFDLPRAPRPAARTPAPARLLPEYDNLVLGHDDRTRVVPDEYRSKICLPNLRILPTMLVDGFVAGTWKTEVSRKKAVLILEPFESLPPKARRE
ncbi:MAG: AlkZ family DNA glycosylase, partial [Acidobacteriota bacterium]